MADSQDQNTTRAAQAARPANSNSRVARWLKALSESNRALWLLALASFLETIIVPIPIETVLIPYMLANKRRIWLIASVTLLGCLVAAVVGYAVGLLLFESLGRWLVDAYGYNSAFASFQDQFARNGFWAILAIGVTPIPFQVAMLVAGVAGYPLWLFVLAALIARGIRYYGLAALVYAFGDAAVDLWHRHSRTAGVIALFVIAALVAAVKLLL